MKALRIFCLGGLLLLYAQVGMGQDTIRTEHLQEVKVNARQHRILTSTSPLQLLDKGDMLRLGVTDMADALHRMPGINLRDYGGAGGMKTVAVRGFGAGHTGVSYDDVYNQMISVADEIGCKFEKDPNTAGVYKITADNRGSKETLTIGMSEEMAKKTGLSNAQGVVQNTDDKSYKLVASGTDAEIELKDGFGSTVITNVEGNRVKITDKGGFSMDFLLSDDIQATGATLVFDVTDVGAMTIQIGANQYQNMDVNIPEVSSESLYLDTVNVAVNGGADKAISTMDAAIAKLSAVRSGIGAYTNRLEYASSSLAETQEDMTTAYSGLMDTDMASEMTEYTQQNILEQAAVSVLSQANDIPQQVLSLLQK